MMLAASAVLAAPAPVSNLQTVAISLTSTCYYVRRFV